MSVQNIMPSDSRFIQTANMFSANFNVPVLGKYSFDVAANSNVNVLKLNLGTVYLIDRISIGGNISESNYLDSVLDNPALVLRYSNQRENLHQAPITILNFTDDQEFATFIHTEKDNNYLSASFSGLLGQIPATLGKQTISITVTFSIYATTNTEFYKMYRGVLNTNAGKSLRG